MWLRSGDPYGSYAEEGDGRASREQLDSSGDQPQPSSREGGYRDRRRRGGGLVHRLLAETEGDGARRGAGPGCGEGPNGEGLRDNECRLAVSLYSFQKFA